MAGDPNHPITTDDEAFERDLNRHRGDEQRRARAEAVTRLASRGIDVATTDSLDAVVDVLEAVELFERAVEAKGGDLMVDTPPAREPDDPRLVLPSRPPEESLADYGRRVRAAAGRLAGRAD